MKRILNISAWVGAFAVIGFLLAFTNISNSETLCTSVKINIERSNADNRFLDSALITQDFGNRQLKLVGERVANINLAQLEDELNNRPDVRASDVYVTLDGHLVMTVNERKPILRVISDDGDSYYIDEEGELMPLSDRFTAHVPVASGFISERYSTYYNYGVKGITANEALKKVLIIDDLYNLAKYISADSLWSAQIDQFYILPNKEIQLVPKIGNGTIAFGDANDMEEKFDKLRAFYKHAIAEGNLSNYQTINLKFKNQVVCTKKQ